MKPLSSTIRRIVLAAIIVTVGLVMVVVYSSKEEARADINRMLNFTGKVTDTDSTAVADNVYNFNFRLFTTATSGTAIWTEDLIAANLFSGTISSVTTNASSTTYVYSSGSATSTLRAGQYLTNASTSEYELITDYSHASNEVTVATTTAWSVAETINNRPRTEGGVVDIDLGAVSDLSSVDFNQALYLEVVFNGETMQPRKLIYAAAQAINADMLDGYHASDFASAADDVTVTGYWTFNNILSIATSSVSTALTVTQSGAGNIVEFANSGGTVFAINNSGAITIGGTGTSYTLPSVRGAVGEILKTDDSGNVTWQAETSGTRSQLIGTTTATFTGEISTSTLTGYAAANDICVSEYAGSHFCRSYDIILTINEGSITAWGSDTSSAWIAEGPPGYTAPANDCSGWTNNADTALGAFWLFNSNGGGAGWVVNCAQTKPLACCTWQ